MLNKIILIFFYKILLLLATSCAFTLPKLLLPKTLPPGNSYTKQISECIQVTSEPGDYVYKKALHPRKIKEETLLEMVDPMNTCGLYIIGEPDTIIEITMKQYDVNCNTGGLMGFVDGWELNGEYFPSEKDHHRFLEDRIVEFCNNYNQRPSIPNKKFFRTSQNAGLLQYRIPMRGSFIVNVRFHKIAQPCNILVQDTSAIYNLANYGHHRNCTLSALFPAVVSLTNVKIGAKNQEKIKYDCALLNDRLEIGGSSGLDSFAMAKASDVCGFSEEQGPEQAIFCGVTNIRLISSGKYQNRAMIFVRKADENDLDLATLICPT